MRNLRLILTKKKYLWVGLFVILLSLVVSARHQFYHLLGQTYPALSITPASINIGNGIPWKFSSVGGVPPYTYSLIGSGGSVDPVTGVYTADNQGGYTVTVRVKDGALQTADATVTVAAAPVVNCGSSPSSTTSLNGRLYDPGGPASDYGNNVYCLYEIDVGRFPLNVHFNSFVTDSVNDDLTVHDWNWTGQVFSGSTVPADLTTPDGYYYFEFESDASGTAAGFDLTWSAANPAQPSITGTTSVAASFSKTYRAVGGTGPYVFSLASGSGTISVVDATSIIYKAPLTADTPVLRVTDALNQTFDLQLTVTKYAFTMSPSSQHGPPAGGGTISFSGSGIMVGATITIGGNNCPVSYNNSTSFIQCVIPAGSPGKVDVVVTNPDGQSATITGGYEYESGTWTTMPAPSTGTRAYNANIWTGDRLIIWSGADPSCTYSTCTKTDGFVYNPITDSWSAMAASPLAGRIDMAHVWTGHEAIIFGGRDNNTIYSNGAKYNPYTNTWTSIATPTWTARQLFSQVWTGKEMILYGGQWSSTAYNSGIAYNPSSNTWRTIASSTARWRHQAVWTGQKMFIYGGATDNAFTVIPSTAGIYDPESDTWTTSSASNLKGKAASTWFNNLSSNFLLWTGNKVFVSGGGDRGGGTKYDAFYDPKTNTWSNPTTDMNSSTYVTSMVWTGDRVVRTMIYPMGGGGATVQSLNVATQIINNLPAPLVQTQGRAIVWTGEDIITCYGYVNVSTGGDCERLDIGSTLKNRLASMSRDSWISMTASGAPSARSGASSIWNGQYFIVWGGSDGSSYLNTGYKYDPYADSWTAISTTGAPTGRTKHTAIWTGSKMLIWGGQTAAGVQTNTGAIYDPTTDTWTDTSVTGSVPTAREDHTAVWSGAKMIIWGGRGSSGVLADGAILDPSTNTWSTLATTGSPPTARARHQALWNGQNMIIWGGDDGSTFANTGSYYDLNASTWTAISTTSAPSARADFVMALAQDKFVVWGGVDSSSNALGDGGIYDLTAGTWSVTSSTGAPSARSQSSSVYAEHSVVIWGGKNGATAYSDGFFLNTQTSSWTALSSSGLGSRYGAQMVWTGVVGDGRANGSKTYRNNLNGDTSRLMIWGGYDGTSYKNDGKIHNLPYQ